MYEAVERGREGSEKEITKRGRVLEKREREMDMLKWVLEMVKKELEMSESRSAGEIGKRDVVIGRYRNAAEPLVKVFAEDRMGSSRGEGKGELEGDIDAEGKGKGGEGDGVNLVGGEGEVTGIPVGVEDQNVEGPAVEQVEQQKDDSGSIHVEPFRRRRANKAAGPPQWGREGSPFKTKRLRRKPADSSKQAFW